MQPNITVNIHINIKGDVHVNAKPEDISEIVSEAVGFQLSDGEQDDDEIQGPEVDRRKRPSLGFS